MHAGPRGSVPDHGCTISPSPRIELRGQLPAGGSRIDSAIAIAGRQPAAIRREGDDAYGNEIIVERLQYGPVARIQHHDALLLGADREPASLRVDGKRRGGAGLERHPCAGEPFQIEMLDGALVRDDIGGLAVLSKSENSQQRRHAHNALAPDRRCRPGIGGGTLSYRSAARPEEHRERDECTPRARCDHEAYVTRHR